MAVGVYLVDKILAGEHLIIEMPDEPNPPYSLVNIVPRKYRGQFGTGEKVTFHPIVLRDRRFASSIRAYQESLEPTPKKIKVGEVAKLLGVHANTVRRLTDQGHLSASRVGPLGHRVYDSPEIEKYLARSKL